MLQWSHFEEVFCQVGSSYCVENAVFTLLIEGVEGKGAIPHGVLLKGLH